MTGRGLPRLGIGSEGGEREFDSVDIEDLDARSQTATYVFYTDGTNVTAIPQQNPEGPSMTEQTGTDIGPVLEEVIVNQLPPQGTEKMARGRIVFRPGEYPGDAANNSFTSAGDGFPAPSHLKVSGEKAAHNTAGEDNSSVPGAENPVRIPSTGDGFVNPNVDSDLVIYFQAENLQLEGPGSGTSGNHALDVSGSNTWDWVKLDNVIFTEFSSPKTGTVSADAPTVYTNCQWRRFSNQPANAFANRTQIIRGGFYADSDTSGRTRVTGRCQVWGTEFRGTGEGAGSVVDFLGESQGFGVRHRKIGGTTDSGVGLRAQDNAQVTMPICTSDSNAYRASHRVDDDAVIVRPRDFSSSRFVVEYQGGTDCDVWGPVLGPNVETRVRVNVGGTRQRFNGVIGGGQIGGVDLSSTNGKQEGDIAIADGTATGASAGDIAIWDADNTQWNVFNADATV